MGGKKLYQWPNNLVSVNYLMTVLFDACMQKDLKNSWLDKQYIDEEYPTLLDQSYDEKYVGNC